MSRTDSARLIVWAALLTGNCHQRGAKPASSALTGFGRRSIFGSMELSLERSCSAEGSVQIYARQCPMVTQPDGGSIPPGSTKLLWVFPSDHQSNTAGPIWFRRMSLMVGSSCREWTPRIKVYQITKAKNIMAKVMGFLKSLVPSFDLNFAPAAMAA